MMNIRAMLLCCFAALSVAVTISGCSGATNVSTQPSESEIQAGIDRRLKAIDDDKNMTPQAKEMAKQRVLGSRGASASRGQ